MRVVPQGWVCLGACTQEKKSERTLSSQGRGLDVAWSQSLGAGLKGPELSGPGSSRRNLAVSQQLSDEPNKCGGCGGSPSCRGGQGADCGAPLARGGTRPPLFGPGQILSPTTTLI